MYVKDIQQIAKMMRQGSASWKISARIERAYKEGEDDRINLYEDSHYIAVAIMQQQGYPVMDEMSYDDINEISSGAEKAYCRWCDRYVVLAEDADLTGVVVNYG